MKRVYVSKEGVTKGSILVDNNVLETVGHASVVVIDKQQSAPRNNALNSNKAAGKRLVMSSNSIVSQNPFNVLVWMASEMASFLINRFF